MMDKVAWWFLCVAAGMLVFIVVHGVIIALVSILRSLRIHDDENEKDPHWL